MLFEVQDLKVVGDPPATVLRIYMYPPATVLRIYMYPSATVSAIHVSTLLTSPCSLVFDPQVASPATVSRCGMVYMEQVHVGMTSLVRTWGATVLKELIGKHKHYTTLSPTLNQNPYLALAHST